MAEAYRRRGHAAEVVDQPAGDGGVDVVLHDDHGRRLIQCKHWKAERVGVAAVRELLGVVTSEGAAGGIVVTSGRFTPDAEAFARNNAIELVDGPALAELVAQVKQGDRQVGDGREAADGDVAAPRCPSCGSEMVRRTARRGERAGSAFWGGPSWRTRSCPHNRLRSRLRDRGVNRLVTAPRARPGAAVPRSGRGRSHIRARSVRRFDVAQRVRLVHLRLRSAQSQLEEELGEAGRERAQQALSAQPPGDGARRRRGAAAETGHAAQPAENAARRAIPGAGARYVERERWIPVGADELRALELVCDGAIMPPSSPRQVAFLARPVTHGVLRTPTRPTASASARWSAPAPSSRDVRARRDRLGA